MASSDWDPALYARFREERTQPFRDLLALVRPSPGMRVVDLGCGTGELTEVLHRHLGARETLGIDASEAMLAAATARAGGGLRFERGDIVRFGAERAWDLVFSNAALQWIPAHGEVLARLAAALTDGGQLAVQLPANEDHPSQQVAAEVATEEPFRTALGGDLYPLTVLAPEAYALLLARLGFRAQHVRLQVYLHALGSRAEVVEFMQGSLLTDYRRRLSADLYQRFFDRYRERLLARLEDTRPHLYAFKRILAWAAR